MVFAFRGDVLLSRDRQGAVSYGNAELKNFAKSAFNLSSDGL